VEKPMSSLVKQLQEKLGDIFSNDKRIVAVYLFGSTVDVSTHQRTDLHSSDIDLGLMIDRKSEKSFTISEEMELEIKIEDALPAERFDLVWLNKVPLPLQFRIISLAKLIYIGNDDIRCEMEERIMQEYYDFLPRLNEFNKEYFEALKREYVG